MRKARIALLLGAVAAGLCLPAAAAVMRLLYLDDIAARSAVIVDAKIVGASSGWNDQHSAINTVYTAQAVQYVKGSLGATFQFFEPGGEAGGLRMSVSGTPSFKPGQETLLMLWTDGKSGKYQCIGLSQGALYVTGQNGVKYVDRSIPIRPGTASVAAAMGGRLDATSRRLDLLLSQLSVATAMAQSANRGAEAR